MAQGLQVWGADGQMEFDTSDAATRYYGQSVGYFPYDWNVTYIDIPAQRSSSSSGGMAVIVSAIVQTSEGGYTANSDVSDLFAVDPMDGFVRVRRTINPATQIPPGTIITVDVFGLY